MSIPEVWLRGPLNDVPALLQPVAHALLQAREEVNKMMAGFPDGALWEKPYGMASPGFHLQHLAGVLDRLFTYAHGSLLSTQQLDELAAEGKPFVKIYGTAGLVDRFNKQVDTALRQLAQADESELTNPRQVGRQKLPSTVIGLYVHAAEHTMRHVGQLLVTVKCILAEK